MKILKDVEDLNAIADEELLYVTIGNFDGVHLGHQDFLNAIKNEASKTKKKYLVITFVPHPAFLLKDRPHYLINTYLERQNLLEKLGVDYLLEINFTRDFSTQSPQEFLKKYIFNCNRIKKIFLGYDFQFGANKEGNFELAKKEAKSHGVELVLHSEYKLKSNAVSSSSIRFNIENGLMENAKELLGREFFLSGIVIKGLGRGKQIGFPTANLGYAKDVIVPAKGVYISRTVIGEMVYDSVTNIGVNPTFNQGHETHVETHLIDFTRDIYGEEIKIYFIKKVRDEKKFSSVNELVKQIETDVSFAKNYFKTCN